MFDSLRKLCELCASAVNYFILYARLKIYLGTHEGVVDCAGDRDGQAVEKRGCEPRELRGVHRRLLKHRVAGDGARLRHLPSLVNQNLDDYGSGHARVPRGHRVSWRRQTECPAVENAAR